MIKLHESIRVNSPFIQGVMEKGGLKNGTDLFRFWNPERDSISIVTAFGEYFIDISSVTMTNGYFYSVEFWGKKNNGRKKKLSVNFVDPHILGSEILLWKILEGGIHDGVSNLVGEHLFQDKGHLWITHRLDIDDYRLSFSVKPTNRDEVLKTTRWAMEGKKTDFNLENFKIVSIDNGTSEQLITAYDVSIEGSRIKDIDKVESPVFDIPSDDLKALLISEVCDISMDIPGDIKTLHNMV